MSCRSPRTEMHSSIATTSARTSSPPTCQIRDVTVSTGLTTHCLQVMHRTRAVPVCPSTPASMPERNHISATFGSQRMLDDSVGAGRAEFVGDTSRRRHVSQGPCPRSFVGGTIQRERACVASHATRQRVSLTPASRRAFRAESSHRYRKKNGSKRRGRRRPVL